MEETNYRNVENSLNWYNDIHSSIMALYQDLLNFSAAFHAKINEAKQKFPYSINVIEELHINENSHSRILYKLLSYGKDNKEYSILNSLLRYITDKYTRKSSFKNIHISNPTITQEKERIDLWVRDRNYAIIFENKIYNAVDQEAQLSRYIEKTTISPFRYNTKDVYIIYLSQDGKEPDEQSWGIYKKDFEDRYLNLSFKDDILPWLKKEVLPNVKNKDYLLRSALEQYIDYLEGLFFLRTSQHKLIMNIDELLKSNLELDKEKDDEHRVIVIQKKIDDLNEVVSAMNSLRDSYRNKIFQEWKKKTKELYPEYQSRGDSYSDVHIPLSDGKTICVYIWEEKSQLYVQAQFDDSTPIHNTIIEKIQDLLPRSTKNIAWRYLGYNDFAETYSLFTKVIEKIQEILEKNKA